MEPTEEKIAQLEASYASKPYDTGIILELLTLVEKNGDWPRVNALLKRLAELEDDPEICARYYFSIGQVYEKHLGEPLDAIEYYDKCMECDSTLMAAFQHMANLIRDQKKWRKLEREYLKMIRRGTTGSLGKEQLFTLHHDLGILYQEHIGDTAKALESFENALAQDPAQLEIRLRMAEMQRGWEGEKKRDALHIYEEILELDPFNRENMIQLFKLHWENQDYDSAWCLSALMKSLNIPNKDADHFYDQHLPKGLVRLQAGSIDGLWRHLIVSEPQDYHLGQLFAFLADILPVLKGESERSLGILGEKPQSRNVEGPTFNGMFYYVIDAYGFADPPLYLLPDRDEGLRVRALVQEGRVVRLVTVGQPLLRGMLERELAFIIGRELLYLLPGYTLIRLLDSRSELITVILGAIKLGSPRLSFGENERIVNKTANQMADLFPREVLDHLGDITRDVMADGAIPDIEGYIDRARLSANRVGFLLGQNLNTALEIMRKEEYCPTGLSFETAQKELIKFAATRDYFELRHRTGISIG